MFKFGVVLVSSIFILTSSIRKSPFSTVSIANRVLTFGNFLPKYKILGYDVKEFGAKNRLACAISCAQTPECKSYSFCHRLCSLYEIGYDELIRNGRFEMFTFTDDQCNLICMNKQFVPQCEQGGIDQSIRNDSNNNICKINQKRVDGAFLGTVSFHLGISYFRFLLLIVNKLIDMGLISLIRSGMINFYLSITTVT